MEFRPFWEILEKLGIALPGSPKAKENARSQPPQPPRLTENNLPTSPADLLRFLEAIEEERSGATESNCWVPPGKIVKVAGFPIPGMVYIGEKLSAVRRPGIEPCLIRPSLQINRRQPDYEGKQLSFGLAYTQMQAGCRAAYLHWLADGRSSTRVNIGYVWLFFYGLERRVLHDLPRADLKSREAAHQELDQIMAEVQRLKEIYGNFNGGSSFQYKAQEFLEICRLMRSPTLDEQPLNLSTARPLLLQIGLGQRVKQGQPIPAEWAFAWYFRLANNALPIAASRCADEFKALFQHYYQQEYGEGLKLKPGKFTLTTNYYPANPSFGGTIEIKVGDLPDISRFSAKLNRIGELVQRCRTELDPLSRLLSRNPSAQNTPAAIALLPPTLLTTHGGELVNTLRQWLDHQLSPSEQVAVVAGQALLQHWGGNNPEKLTKTEATGLSQLLEQLGFGMEPDPRLGGAVPTLKSYVALFRRSEASPPQLSPAYGDATLFAHLAIAVASGDEPPSPIEQQYLESQLTAQMPVEPWERVRFHAHLRWLLETTPTLRSLKARIERVSQEQREAIARFIVQVAAADGHPTPKEVQLLEKAYGALGVDSQVLYSNIHDRTTAGNSYASGEPVTVRPGAAVPGHAIPSAPKRKTQKHEGLALDMTLVQSKLEESHAISSLLSEIFVDDDIPSPGTPPATVKPKKSSRNKKTKPAASTTPAMPTVAGLDAPHSALLLSLEQQTVWQRDELAAIATNLDLMLDGALEVINDVAFDRCDEAVIEGEDCLEVNGEVLQKLLHPG